MISRYADPRIDTIFSDMEKLLRWQRVELAVIHARFNLGEISGDTYSAIRVALESNPPDVDYWKQKDEELKHDLNAFVEERRRFIPTELQFEFHKDMTSYDTEEAAFADSLTSASDLVDEVLGEFLDALNELAKKHQYTIMLERTHGQWAKLRSFGGRVLTWKQELLGPGNTFDLSRTFLPGRSRISGAIGNYGGNMTPDLESEALEILNLEPFRGATQIMPRTMYAPLAQSLQLLCQGVGKIALDIRLGARSGSPIVQEPFGKMQMGSSAMPHKKNTITTEQMTGMVRLADAYTGAIVANCATWEGRAIEQSSVERVAWPDLFHVTLRMLTSMTRIVKGLTVYPDNMLREIVESRGTYASDEAKNFLAEELAKRGHDAKIAYNILQLACFNVFKPESFWLRMRNELCESLVEANLHLSNAANPTNSRQNFVSIQDLIPQARLSVTDELGGSEKDVADWNILLREIFWDKKALEEWYELFRPSRLLKEEAFLFEKLLSS